MRPAEVPRRFPRGNIRSSDRGASSNGRPKTKYKEMAKIKNKGPNPNKIGGMGIIETLDWVSRKEQKFCGFLSLRLLMMQTNASKTPMAKQEMTREKLSGDLSLGRGLKRNGVCCAKSLLFQKEVKIVGVVDVDRRVSRKIKNRPLICVRLY